MKRLKRVEGLKQRILNLDNQVLELNNVLRAKKKSSEDCPEIKARICRLLEIRMVVESRIKRVTGFRLEGIGRHMRLVSPNKRIRG